MIYLIKRLTGFLVLTIF